MSVRMLYHKYCGIAANSGYALFYSPGTSTAKTTYTSDYTTAQSLNAAGGVVISSDGWLSTYLLGDYDVSVFTRTGVAIPSASADGINPQEADIESQGGNLLSNASFETDTNGDLLPDGWTITEYTGGDVALDSSDQQHGAKSLKFVSVGTGGGIAESEAFMECSPVRSVVVAFALKSTAAVRNLVEINWYTSAQATISSSTIYDNDATNPTSWAAIIGSAIPPSTARYFKIKIYGCHSSDATSGTARFDNVEILQGPGFPSNYTPNFRGYLRNDGTNGTGFDIDTNVTETTFETVGPTGSGATNIWTALDDMPKGARGVILKFESSFTTNATTGGGLAVYGEQGGAGGTVTTSTKLYQFEYEAVASGDVVVLSPSTIMVPLDTSGRFETTWGATADSARSVNVALQGYMI